MPRTLILPDRMAPSNLHLRPSVKTRFVEGDLYDISRRIQELSPNLYILELTEGDKSSFAIMERAKNGVEMLVYKVKELDGRVLERLRYLMAHPLNERLKIIEADEYKLEAQQKEDELEELYENLGAPMLSQLFHDGFIDTRPVSYAKRGVTGGRGSLKRS